MGTLRLYTKHALTISEQIELLKNRGLNITDSSKAEKILGEVSYFRFVQYLRPMEADKTTYAISCCIAYWLDSMGYGDDFKNNLKSLLISYPQVDPSAMGFPNNWHSEPLWR